MKKTDVDQTLLKGITAYNQGNIQEAERLYKAVLKLYPKHPEANHNLGIIEVSINQHGMALPRFKIAIDANPNIERFWLSYIEALIAERLFANATQALLKAQGSVVDKEKLKILLHKLESAKTRHTQTQAPSHSQTQELLNHYQNGLYEDAESLAILLTQQFPRYQFG